MALWVETFPPFSPDLQRALSGSHIGITANPVVIGPFFNGEPVAWHNTCSWPWLGNASLRDRLSVDSMLCLHQNHLPVPAVMILLEVVSTRYHAGITMIASP